MRERKARGVLFLILSFILFPSSFFLVSWWFRGWNGRDPVNIVVSSGEHLRVLAVRPAEQRVVEVNIPDDMLVSVAGHGAWRTSTLWRLSELEDNSRIVESIGWDFLEVPIDGLLRVEDWGDDRRFFPLGGIFYQIKHMNALCFFLIKFCEQREWSLPETVRLLNFRRALTDSRHVVVALQDEAPARRIVDAGGGESIELDSSVLSSRVLDWFGVAEFRTRGLTFAVRNTSGEPGKAAKVARLLEHSGLRVVSVGNGEGERGILVLRDQDSKSLVVRRLSQWFDLPVVSSEHLEERADVVIVI